MEFSPKMSMFGQKQSKSPFFGQISQKRALEKLAVGARKIDCWPNSSVPDLPGCVGRCE